MKFEYFLIIFLINSIKADEIVFEFKHTDFFQLINDNYILCTEKGIYLYDSKLKNKISEHNFTTEVSSASDFYFVNIDQFSLNDGGNIIILYKDKFYFYSKEGEYLFSTDLPFQQTGTSYTLVPYKEEEQLNVIIGYSGSNKNTMIGYYNINIFNKTLSEIITTNITLRTNSKYPQYSTQADFRCQLMESYTYGKVLTCFYVVNNYFCVNSYNIESNFTETLNYSLCDQNLKTNYIKSAITPEKDKAIICCTFTDQKQVVCNCYDINEHKFISTKTFGVNIQLNIFAINVFYSKKTKEFIASGYDYNGNFTISIFDSDLNTKKDENKNEICNPNFHVSKCQVNYFSIIFFSELNNYSLMTSCYNNSGIKSIILPESCKPTEIMPSSNIKDDHKSYSYEEVSITTNMKTIYSLVNTTIKNTFPPIKTEITYLSSVIHKSLSSTSILSLSSSHFSSSISSSSKIVSLLSSSFLKSNPSSHSIKISNNILPITSSALQISSYKIKSSNISPIISTLISEDIKDKEINKTIIMEPDEKCPEEYLYENKNTKICTNSCEISQLLNKECSINHITPNNIEEITNQIKKILNNTNIKKDTNIVITGNNVIYQITSSDNININKKSNISIIEFGECEKKLKDYYDIDNLIIFKMDLKLNNSPPTIINYEVYNPKNLTKLDLSICQNMKIALYSPYTPSQESLNKIIQLNEYGYDLYNPKDSFYQDICSPFTSENETDILLSDRKSDFFENISLCEDICTYNGYDYTIEKAKCECSIKGSIDLNINKVVSKEANILSNFDLSSFSNIKILKCYKLVFSKLGQKNNIGSYIFIIIILIFITLSLIYIINKLSNIATIIRKALHNIDFSKISPYSPASPLKRKDMAFKGRNKRKSKTRASAGLINSKTNLYYVDIQDKDTQKEKANENLPNKRRSLNRKKGGTVRISSNFKKLLPFSNNKTKKLSFSKKVSLTKKIDKNLKRENTNNFNDEELNSLSYKEAIKYDKRTYIQYYWALIKKKQLILFTFVLDNDYNIFTIKLALFLFSFSLYFSVNTLFFEDKTMHTIYINKGKLSILYQIPVILYSTIISSVISIIIKIFALSEKEILKIRKIKDKPESLKKSSELAKSLKLKFNIFFLISLLFLVLFWYCISAFCAVYKNTQKILIKRTLGSFGLSLIYPFGLNLFPGLFRIPSLRAVSKDKECLYKFSRILALI